MLASSAAVCAIPVEGWYSSVFGGYSYIPDNISINRLGFTLNHASYNSGYHVGGRIGYQSNPMRYEGEITYIQSNIKTLNIYSIRQHNVSGHTSATAAMANVYYDFPAMVPCVQPFLGVGLGFAGVDTKFYRTAPLSGLLYRGSNSVFAYQATGGLTYNFAENYALNIAYRYFGTDRVDNLGKVYQANLGTFGVIYRFDEASYK